jgi:hypothetical protein
VDKLPPFEDDCTADHHDTRRQRVRNDHDHDAAVHDHDARQRVRNDDDHDAQDDDHDAQDRHDAGDRACIYGLRRYR